MQLNFPLARSTGSTYIMSVRLQSSARSFSSLVVIPLPFGRFVPQPSWVSFFSRSSIVNQDKPTSVFTMAAHEGHWDIITSPTAKTPHPTVGGRSSYLVVGERALPTNPRASLPYLLKFCLKRKRLPGLYPRAANFIYKGIAYRAIYRFLHISDLHKLHKHK